MSIQIHENFLNTDLRNFSIKTISIESKSLKGNPLKDSTHRLIPVLIPKDTNGPLKVVMVLAGFSGVGSKYFNLKFKEQNFPQMLDALVSKGKAPKALYVFVDAITYWGGSQFLNSKGTGNYEDFLMKDLVPVVKEQFNTSSKAKDWCMFGGSSGGYGALHYVSKFPNTFGYAVAIAPDSFFDMSLLPEIYTAMPVLDRFGGVDGIKKEIEAGKFLNRRDAHSVLNAIGMGTCYSPHPTKKHEVLWPIDKKTGELNQKIWKTWKSHDPVEFLKKRKAKLAKVKGIYLDVGTRDQYYLQYGARQIHKVLKAQKAKVTYSEFNGNHFDISDRRPQAYQWLMKHGF